MNPIYNLLNPINPNIINQFEQFRRNFKGNNPQEIVQNLLNTGRMSQAQFNQYQNQAMQILSMMKK